AKLSMSEKELSARLESARQILFKHREQRIHPSKDDKILTDWNGLMIAAQAKAGRALESSDYENSARKAADFLLNTMRKPDGSLLHRYRNADAAIPGNLDDYAFLTWGLIELYQLTFDVSYLQNAIALTDYQIEHFWDDRQGGFFFTADDSENLLVRTREIYDAAVPSGNSVSALNLLRLAKFTANTSYVDRASQIASSFSNTLSSGPASATLLMCALEFAFGASHEIVIVGNRESEDTRAMLEALNKINLPHAIVVLKSPETAVEITKAAPYIEDFAQKDDHATAYVCRNFTCALPTDSVEEMLKLLE
ncbi:thioredoxin domain-containing protein, partial [bacterium]|nr:thioredoxin domain-containing protein [bacterium]